jgi:TPR repeat protein
VEDAQAAIDRGEYIKALLLLRPSAEHGLAAAPFQLGLMYEIGQGVPQDHAEAAQWCRKAADQGYAPAQFQLDIYENELGVPQY